MHLESYTVDVIENVRDKIDEILDDVAELESDIMGIVDDDEAPIFIHIDNIREYITVVCGLLGI